MDLAGLDHQNVTGAGLELLSVHGPEAAAFSHELDFIVGMAMRPGATPGGRAEEEHGDVDVAVIGPDELVRAALKGQIFLPDTMHTALLLWRWCVPRCGGEPPASCPSGAPLPSELAPSITRGWPLARARKLT
jgi:hypothetical protein